MAYIVACIEFDDNNNLKNVNIVDDESNLSTDTLETLIEKKEKNFYIKIQVNPCSSGESDCFMLSNYNYFKLDFETSVPTGNILSEAFLSGTNASSTLNTNGSNASGSNVPGSNVPVAPSSFDDFKARIIQELTDAIKTNPTVQSDFDNFKKRIIEELTKALPTP